MSQAWLYVFPDLVIFFDPYSVSEAPVFQEESLSVKSAKITNISISKKFFLAFGQSVHYRSSSLMLCKEVGNLSMLVVILIWKGGDKNII